MARRRRATLGRIHGTQFRARTHASALRHRAAPCLASVQRIDGGRTAQRVRVTKPAPFARPHPSSRASYWRFLMLSLVSLHGVSRSLLQRGGELAQVRDARHVP